MGLFGQQAIWPLYNSDPKQTIDMPIGTWSQAAVEHAINIWHKRILANCEEKDHNETMELACA